MNFDIVWHAGGFAAGARGSLKNSTPYWLHAHHEFGGASLVTMGEHTWRVLTALAGLRRAEKDGQGIRSVACGNVSALIDVEGRLRVYVDQPGLLIDHATGDTAPLYSGMPMSARMAEILSIQAMSAIRGIHHGEPLVEGGVDWLFSAGDPRSWRNRRAAMLAFDIQGICDALQFSATQPSDVLR